MKVKSEKNERKYYHTRRRPEKMRTTLYKKRLLKAFCSDKKRVSKKIIPNKKNDKLGM